MSFDDGLTPEPMKCHSGWVIDLALSILRDCPHPQADAAEIALLTVAMQGTLR